MIAINNSFTALNAERVGFQILAKYSNANGSPLVITTPVTTLKKGKIRVMVSTLVSTKNRLLTLVSSPVSTKKAFYKSIPEGKNKTKYSNAYQNEKSYLWQAIALFNLAHNVDDLYQNSKLFTKAVKAGYEFLNNIKRAWLIIGVHKKGLAVFRHVRRELTDTLANKSYLTGLLSFSRQALITHAEKLELSFFARSSICSMSSWGKRTPLVKDLLFLYPVAILWPSFIKLVFTHYTINKLNKKALTCICTLFYSVYTPIKCFRLKITMPCSGGTLSRHLTTKLLELVIMANRYDSAHLRAGQSKVFKFYNILTAQTVQTIATSDEQARTQLNSNNLAFISRKPLSLGVYYA